MEKYFHLLGVIIVCYGVLACSRALQKAARELLSPEQLVALLSQRSDSLFQLFLPVSPILLVYLVLPRFPDFQTIIIILAFSASAGISALQYRASTHRLVRQQIPATYMAARGRATILLAVCMAGGLFLILWSKLR